VSLLAVLLGVFGFRHSELGVTSCSDIFIRLRHE
jgi:hypothetical protein